MYIQKSGSDLGSDHTFYTIYGIQPADHPLHGGLVVDIKIYVAGKYSFIGTQIDLAHIHSHDQRDVAGDLVQQTDPVNSLDGEAHRKRLAVIILPLRHDNPVSMLGGDAVSHRARFLVHCHRSVRRLDADDRVSWDRPATGCDDIITLLLSRGLLPLPEPRERPGMAFVRLA